MSYKIVLTDKFKKNYKKLDSNVKKQLNKKIEIMQVNPMHPSLRTKWIQGTNDLFEFSVNMDVRVIWHYAGEQLILLLDIGHHDILNRK